jgi:hypothetical protein
MRIGTPVDGNGGKIEGPASVGIPWGYEVGAVCRGAVYWAAAGPADAATCRTAAASG